jgi:hypothetical protein
MNAEELRVQLMKEACELEDAEFAAQQSAKKRLSEVETKLGECKSAVEGSLSEVKRRLESVEEVQQLIHAIYESTNHTKSELSNLMLSFSAFASKQAAIEKGFPDGDPDGHRRHHEALIRKAIARAVFWEKLLAELSKWGILGVIGFIGTAVWIAIKNEAHK